MNEEDYDVVIDALQRMHDKLWSMTQSNEMWGVMDHIRLEQMQELKRAMKIWKEHKDA